MAVLEGLIHMYWYHPRLELSEALCEAFKFPWHCKSLSRQIFYADPAADLRGGGFLALGDASKFLL